MEAYRTVPIHQTSVKATVLLFAPSYYMSLRAELAKSRRSNPAAFLRFLCSDPFGKEQNEERRVLRKINLMESSFAVTLFFTLFYSFAFDGLKACASRRTWTRGTISTRHLLESDEPYPIPSLVINLPPSTSATPPLSLPPLFPAIFTFGDSTLDVGTNNFLKDPGAFKADFVPYGEDFDPMSGRFCNGRLAVDFWAEYIGLPSSQPFQNLNATNSNQFLHGINFASAGSGVLDTTDCQENTLCISLTEQLSQFSSVRGNYSTDVLAKSLFIISIGSNDYLTYVQNATLLKNENIFDFIHNVISGLVDTIEFLYFHGARKFVVGNIPSLGCVPAVLAYQNVSQTDPSCSIELNSVVTTHNIDLEARISELRITFPGINVIVIDLQQFSYEITNSPESFGLSVGFGGCCGKGPFNGIAQCGTNGTTNCLNQNQYVFWDLFHFTEATNQIIATAAFEGNTMFTTPYGIQQLARL